MAEKIKMWRNNNRTNWEINPDDLANEFWNWDSKNENLSEIWPLGRCIRKFITDKDTDGGLQSVFDEKDYNTIYTAVRVAWPSKEEWSRGPEPYLDNP